MMGLTDYRLECRACRYQSVALVTDHRSFVRVEEGGDAVHALVISPEGMNTREGDMGEEAEREGRLLTTRMWHCQDCGQNTARHEVWSSRELPPWEDVRWVGILTAPMLLGFGAVWLGARMWGTTGAMAGWFVTGVFSLPAVIVWVWFLKSMGAWLLNWRNGEYRRRWAKYRKERGCGACGSMRVLEAMTIKGRRLMCPGCKQMEVEEVYVEPDFYSGGPWKKGM